MRAQLAPAIQHFVKTIIGSVIFDHKSTACPLLDGVRDSKHPERTEFSIRAPRMAFIHAVFARFRNVWWLFHRFAAI